MVAAPSPARPGRRRWAPTRFHLALGVAGAGLGLAGALLAERRAGSWLVAFVVFVVVSYAVGRAAPEAILGPQRVRRAAFFAVWPVTCALVFALAYGAWERALPATIVAFAAAFAASETLGRTLFRRIRLEEAREALDLALERTRPGR